MPASPLASRSSRGSRRSCCARSHAGVRAALSDGRRRTGRHERRPHAGHGAASSPGACTRIAQEALTLRAHLRRACGRAGSIRRRGPVAPELAARLGLTGSRAARAARRSICAATCPASRTTSSRPQKIVRSEGDVAARVAVRFDELQESCRLIQRILEALPAGLARYIRTRCPPTGAIGVGIDRGLARTGIGRARSGRGRRASAVAIRTIPRGRTGRCSSTRSSATSSRISRSSISRSTCPTADTICSAPC